MKYEELFKLPHYPVALATSPVVLTEGQNAVLDTSLLAAPNREPLLLTEIGFQIISAPNNHPGFNFGLGGTIKARIAIGSQCFTHGRTDEFVPAWLLAPVIQDVNETGPYEPYLLGGTNWFTYARWTFRRPLYLLPDDALSVSLTRLVDNLGGSATVNVYAIGRALLSSERPVTRHLPVAAYYQHPVGQTVSQTNNTDLVNWYRQPIAIDHMIGRLESLPPFNAGFNWQIFEALDNDSGLDDIAFTNPTTYIQMKSSLGTTMVRDPTPFYKVFNLLDRRFTFNGQLAPNEYLIAQFSGVYDNYAPSISMIGSREVRL